MGNAQQQVKKGWFSTEGRPGDRQLADQMKGLDWLFANCAGKTILDVGCAEGLISIELAKAGAVAVHGVEIVRGHVEVGNKLRGDLPVTLEVADMNVWQPRRQYDIVIGLAILQKLRLPSTVVVHLAHAAREAVVLRLPPENAPFVIDARSGNVPWNISSTLFNCGFNLIESSNDGHFGEWVGVWKRR
jgi:2-polyprenyl-3-methyl-5-hydroxy-6-metoxy-1,4-benzoquinol methylase